MSSISHLQASLSSLATFGSIIIMTIFRLNSARHRKVLYFWQPQHSKVFYFLYNPSALTDGASFSTPMSTFSCPLCCFLFCFCTIGNYICLQVSFSVFICITQFVSCEIHRITANKKTNIATSVNSNRDSFIADNLQNSSSSFSLFKVQHGVQSERSVNYTLLSILWRQLSHPSDANMQYFITQNMLSAIVGVVLPKNSLVRSTDLISSIRALVLFISLSAITLNQHRLKWFYIGSSNFCILTSCFRGLESLHKWTRIQFSPKNSCIALTSNGHFRM